MKNFVFQEFLGISKICRNLNNFQKFQEFFAASKSGINPSERTRFLETNFPSLFAVKSTLSLFFAKSCFDPLYTNKKSKSLEKNHNLNLLQQIFY
jgi:hypothetical protein